MWWFFKPVAIKVDKSLLMAGSTAIKECATVKHVIKSTIMHSVGAVLGAMVDQLALKLIDMRDKHDAAPPAIQPIVEPKMVQTGSGRKRHCAPLYTKAFKRVIYSSNKQPVIYNF